MDGGDSDLNLCSPPLYYTFGLPIDDVLKTAYDAYKPSAETLGLGSECGRSIFADQFIENPQLGTLHDLAIQTISKYFGGQLAITYEDPLDERIHYSYMDLELPIERIYDVDNDYYWKKMVLKFSPDKTLILKKDVDWKGIALSMKFVDILENCPAEYFFMDEMLPKAMLIKDFVKEMHIKKLQPLQESSFEQYFLSESDSQYLTPSQASETISTISGSIESEEPGIEQVTETLVGPKKVRRFRLSGEEEGEEEFEEEEEQEVQSKPLAVVEIEKSLYTDPDLEKSFLDEEGELEEEKSSKINRDDEDYKRLKALKRKAKAAQLIRRAERDEKKERRMAKILEKQSREIPGGKKKKKPQKEIEVKNVYDIPIEASDPELLPNLEDKRNIDLYIKKKKRFQYDSAYCHHVNLSIIGIFTELQDFSISFHPGDTKYDYHPRLYRFSYQDMQNLARGLRNLTNLRIFRLTNSEMDERKLQILVDGLNQIHKLEVIDLSYDQLKDYYGYMLYDLVAKKTELKELILDKNNFGKTGMKYLARGIIDHKGSIMERLSLAFNPVTNEGLHSLAEAIIRTGHFKTLNFPGIHIDLTGISCCIAWELLRRHEPLRDLNLVGVPINREAAIEILKVLFHNYKLLYFDRRNCDIDSDLDEEIEIALMRNHYMLENPYIHDDSQTFEDVKKFVEKIKSPILLECKRRLDKRKICLENQPEWFLETSTSEIQEGDLDVDIDEVRLSLPTLKKDFTATYDSDTKVTKPEAVNYCLKLDAEADAPVTDFNDLTYAQFKKRCSLPGLEQRYSYFRRQLDYQEKALVVRQKERLEQLFRK